jgi:iron-sulfur cluster repair protein YtfE (RIC family)
MNTTTKRATKMQRYINSLNYDIAFLKDELEKMIQQKRFLTWVHGEKKSRVFVREKLQELRQELERINSEPGYKPWQDMDI